MINHILFRHDGFTLKARIHYFLLLIAFIVGCYPAVSLAQEADDSLRVDLDPIEVTAMHSVISTAEAPAALSTVTRDLDEISGSATLSLEDFSQQIPGIWVSDRQNYALGERLTIRGVGWRSSFGVRGVQVVLNDMPLTVADGQTMLNIVDPTFIRRAELLRGPASSYWGNSSGGVLYLSTKSSRNEGNDFSLKSMAGSYGTQKVDGHFSISTDNHRANGYASYLNTDGYRDYSAAQMFRSGITGDVELTSRSQLQYQVATITMPKAQHPSALTAEDAENNPSQAVSSFVDAGAGKQINQQQAGMSYMLETGAGTLDITGYGIYRDLTNPLAFGIITVNRTAGGLRTTFDKDWEQLNIKVGLETKYQHDDREEFENEGNARRGAITVDQVEQVWNQALFSTATYSIDDFNILGGLRYDRITFDTDAPSVSQSGSRSFEAVSPTVGVNYQPGNQNVFANVSTSFEAPTTTELVNRPGGGNGFNPDLKPEQTLGVETGIRGALLSQGLSYDLTLYRLWIDDLLFPYQLETDGPTFYRNQGETHHTGIEANISWQINQALNVAATTTITNAKFDEGTVQDNEGNEQSLSGNEIPGISPFRLNGKISWTPGNFRTSLSYKHVSSYTADNLNTSQNEAYNIFDASASFKKVFQSQNVDMQPFVRVKNILDTRYNGSVTVNAFGGRYFEPAPGRNLQAGITVNF